MSFEDALEDLADKTREFGPSLTTEEATKTAIIMPFIGRVLGYDVFNPAEVVPEYVADLGLKKGEKVDFAIVSNGQVQILIEAKKIGEPLNVQHAGQLVRYFHTSNARIAVLTNGQHWHFFTDLESPNRMDEKPFLRLDLLDIDPYTLPELRKLTKDAFDLDSVLAAAEELKYVSEIKKAVAEQFADPSEELVKLLAARVWDRSWTLKARELFKGITAKALGQFINERVNDRLKSALAGANPVVEPAVNPGAAEPVDSVVEDSPRDRGVETTLEEMEGFHIVRAIVVSDVDYHRVVHRDNKSYFGIILDDNNRKPICRLWFNRGQKYLGVFDEAKNETRLPIDSVEDIYRHAEQLRETARRFS